MEIANNRAISSLPFSLKYFKIAPFKKSPFFWSQIREKSQKSNNKFTVFKFQTSENSKKSSNKFTSFYSQICQNGQKSTNKFTLFWFLIRQNSQKSRNRFTLFRSQIRQNDFDEFVCDLKFEKIANSSERSGPALQSVS